MRGGGGVTHLAELLGAVRPAEHGFSNVVVWSGSGTLAQIEERGWLVKAHDPLLDGALHERVFWQRFRLKSLARSAECDLLFVPGGSDTSEFRPIVTMSQNLLPFDWRELRRYRLSLMTLRMMLLRFIQTRTFRKADGVIFLSEYAKNRVLEVTGRIGGRTPVVPHGLNPRFLLAPRAQKPIVAYNAEYPFRLLYVSIIDQYKHQWQVVKAVGALRREGLPLVLDLVGTAYAPALARLRKTLARLDSAGEWVHYHGSIPYAELHQKYAAAELGIFASTCETFGMILLETMAAGLPVACANRGPMPALLGDAGVYFDPEEPADIARALRELIASPRLRADKAQASYLEAQRYTWEQCASDTFAFLAKIARQHRSLSCAGS